MCQRVTCKDCGKPSFRGCGRHVEQVLGDVSPADRCACGAEGAKAAACDSCGISFVDWMADLFKSRKSQTDGEP